MAKYIANTQQKRKERVGWVLVEAKNTLVLKSDTSMWLETYKLPK